MDEIEIDLTFKPKDEAEAQEVLALLEAEGARDVQKSDDYGLIDAGLTFFAFISIAALVNAIIKLSQLWAACILVDTRGKKIRVTTTSDGPRGSVIWVSGPNDKVVVERPTEMSFASLVASILKKSGHIKDSAS